MKKIEEIAGSKLSIDGEEYLRVDGVWFTYDLENEKYIPINRPDFEALYKETFEND
jgi:hypothetical protein